jgi:hypothetical protein
MIGQLVVAADTVAALVAELALATVWAPKTVAFHLTEQLATAADTVAAPVAALALETVGAP